MKNKKIHYGWYMVAACFALLFFGVGISYNCLALFIKPISEGLGLSRASVAMVQTMVFATTFSLSFVAGKIYGKFGVKNIIRFGAVITPLSWVLFSLSNNLILLYLSAVVLGIGVYSASMMACSIILGNWFKDKLGTVTGIAFMGSGFGGMLFNAITGMLLSKFSWQTCMLILAVVMFATMIPLNFFIIKTSPDTMGLAPYTVDTPAANASAAPAQSLSGLTLKQAMGTYQFWLFAISFTLFNIPGNIASQTMSAHLTDVGHSIAFAANISAFYMGVLALGKVVLGAFFDKKGLRLGCVASCVTMGFTYVGLCFATNLPMLILAVVCMGIGVSFCTIGNPTITRQMFGSRDYASIYGIIAAFASMGGLLSPIISNSLFEIFGSYNIAYIMCAVLCAVLIFLMQAAVAKKPSFKE